VKDLNRLADYCLPSVGFSVFSCVFFLWEYSFLRCGRFFRFVSMVLFFRWPVFCVWRQDGEFMWSFFDPGWGPELRTLWGFPSKVPKFYVWCVLGKGWISGPSLGYVSSIYSSLLMDIFATPNNVPFFFFWTSMQEGVYSVAKVATWVVVCS